ncbi:uncharacterized protein LOC143851275 [Tasmannia lanceolata]|uniref:uncharacterized protein LOC143851275 n=1 Tax=Tasmannia lanceolata TaxID=3420 RepID=UPI004064312B
MKSLVGGPGTVTGLLLRTGQCLFAAASIGAMVSSSGFSNYSAFWYGPFWISTTLVFMLLALGNCATYLMTKRNNQKTEWSFDVNYVKLAACIVYGYLLVVPAAFYFLLQYFGSNTSLIRLWCMWGYSLFIVALSSFLLVIPVEFLRWIMIILVGSASACFVALNIKTHLEGSDLTVVVISSLVLQFALAIFIKIYFFP